MILYQNPKVLGAFLVGTGMVLGAYVFANFGKPNSTTTPLNNVAAASAPERLFVPVSDSDDDGVEDWRDQFVTAPATNLTKNDKTSYIPPTTLTGQLGISLMEGLITAKGGAPISKTEEQVVSGAVDRLAKVATSDYVYGLRNAIVTSDISSSSIRDYGNTLANILLTESVPSLDNELVLLQDFLADPTAEDKKKDLITLAGVYKNYRDKTIATPVPKIFLKEHLDLVNVYNAMYLNIDAMTKAGSDPMMPFVRLKRYEDDVKGLALAMVNIYNDLVPYAAVFDINDPAILFANFYPGRQ